MPHSVAQPTRAQDAVGLTIADTPALVRRFVEVPYEVYRGNPHWVAPLRRDELRRFDPRHNAFLEHADVTLWLATAGGRTRGRIAAIEDRLYEQTHGERIAWFGFFEADGVDTAVSLLAAVEQWARDRRLPIVRGPANPSLNESGGLLIDAFDLDPVVLMPYNPPEYAAYIEAAGFVNAKDLLAWTIDVQAGPSPRIRRAADRVARRRDITVRHAVLRRFDAELATMQAIYRRAWFENWGFVPPTDAEIRQLAVELKPILDPELLLFAELNGKAVACAVAIPDVNQVLKKMNGRLFPFGLVHFLNRSRIITQIRLLLLGVLPEYRHLGLFPLLVNAIHSAALARGYKTAELSWTLEDNDEINAGIEAAGGRRYKTYRIYEKPVG